jgi:hypothetical protein
MLALWADTASLFSTGRAFCPIESPCPSRLPEAAVIFPLVSVTVTSTGPYWVLLVAPVKLPDLPAGALVAGAAGVVGALVGALVAGALEAGAVVLALDGVLAGAVEAGIDAEEEPAVGVLLAALDEPAVGVLAGGASEDAVG